jgi:hypothetical protein
MALVPIIPSAFTSPPLPNKEAFSFFLPRPGREPARKIRNAREQIRIIFRKK